MRDSRRRNPEGLGRWWILAPLLAPLAVFADALAGRRLLAPGDGYSYYLPLHLLASRIWRAGDIPGWNPFTFSGSPLLALNQAAALYPPNLLFLVLPPAIANNVTVVASFLVAGTGAYLLARHLYRDPVGAAVAGLAFGLSGFMFAHLGHQSMIASIAWLPWAFLGYELVRERLTPLRLLLGGGALALALIAGHAQMFFVALLALGVHAGAVAVLVRRSTPVRPLVVLVLVTGAGMALAAVQLIPTALVLPETDRATLSYEAATTYSYTETHLPLLVFPYLFGNNVPVPPFTARYQGLPNLTELSGYPGVVALCLGAAGMWAARRDRRMLGLMSAAVVSMLIALGSSTPFGRLFYELPVYGQFRNWGRFVVVVDLAIAIFAGYGVTVLRSVDARERRVAAKITGGVAVLVLLAALVLPHVGAIARFMVDGPTRGLALALPAGFAIGAAVVAAVAIRSTRAVPALTCVLVAADALLSFGAFYEWRSGFPNTESLRSSILGTEPAPWGPVVDSPGGIDRFVYASLDVTRMLVFPNISVPRELHSANGVDPLAPRRYLEAVGGMVYYGGVTRPEDLWRPGSDVLDLLRTSVVLVDEEGAALPGEGALLAGSTSVPERSLLRYEHTPRLQEAFVVGAVRQASSSDVLAATSGRVPFDPAAEALVDEPCVPCAGLDQPGPAGSASVERPGSQAIDVEVRAERPGVVVVSEAWFPGWEVTVDGRPAPVLRVDGLVLGVPVDAGHHTVALRYRVPGLLVGGMVSGVALAGLLAGHLLLRRRSATHFSVVTPTPPRRQWSPDGGD